MTEMTEQIRLHLAALNAAWQRYAHFADDQLDPATAEALNRDYVKAREGLEACGIAEWMLSYDPKTLTFSLPASGEMADDVFATVPMLATEEIDDDAFATVLMPAVTNRSPRSQWHTDDPDTQWRQLL